MAPLRLLFTSLLALGAVAFPAAKVVRSEDMDSYLPTSWTVQAFPDGPLLELNGTATEIHSQLLALNPDFDTDFPSFQAEINAMLSPYLVKQKAHKRQEETNLPARDLPTTWSVQAFPDGPMLQLNGTIDEVHTQLIALNPNFDADFPSFEAEVNAMKWLDQMAAQQTTGSKRSIPLDSDSEWTVQAFPNGPFLEMSGPIDKVHAQLLKLNPGFDVDFPSFVADHQHQNQHQYQHQHQRTPNDSQHQQQVPDDSQLQQAPDDNKHQQAPDNTKHQNQHETDPKNIHRQSRLSTRSASAHSASAYSTSARSVSAYTATGSFANVQPECNKHKLTFISYVQTGIEYLHKLKSPAPKNAAYTCGRVSCAYDASIYWCNNNDQPLTLNSWSDIAHGAQRIMNQCTSSNVPFGYLGGNVSHPTDNWSVLVKYERC